MLLVFDNDDARCIHAAPEASGLRDIGGTAGSPTPQFCELIRDLIVHTLIVLVAKANWGSAEDVVNDTQENTEPLWLHTAERKPQAS